MNVICAYLGALAAGSGGGAGGLPSPEVAPLAPGAQAWPAPPRGQGQQSPPPGPGPHRPDQGRPGGEGHPLVGAEQQADVVGGRVARGVHVHERDGVQGLHQPLNRGLHVREARLPQAPRLAVGRDLPQQPPECRGQQLDEPLALLTPPPAPLTLRLSELNQVTQPGHGDSIVQYSTWTR